VAPERLFIVGFGEWNPVADNSTEAGRARNRRIELRVEPLTRPAEPEDA
jgi:chemotaxis protein MotB